MLTEVDTRTEYGTGRSIAWFYDPDTGEHTISVDGFKPLEPLDADAARAAFDHPYVYLPLEAREDQPPQAYADLTGPQGTTDPPEASESASPALEGLTQSQKVGYLLVGLTNALKAMDDSDFRWTVGLVADALDGMCAEREKRDRDRDNPEPPYDQEADNRDNDLPF